MFWVVSPPKPRKAVTKWLAGEREAKLTWGLGSQSLSACFSNPSVGEGRPQNRPTMYINMYIYPLEG